MIKWFCILVITQWLSPFLDLGYAGESLPIKPTAKLLVKIKPVFNGRPLQLDKPGYVTENGDTVIISTFKFYLGTLRLSDASNRQQGDKIRYHLINAEDSASLVFTIEGLDATQFKNLSFTIGVDSLSNVSGALDGALDPVNGMYWAWNTGYINAKIEGTSTVCKTLHHAFEFHIGGYLPPYKTLRHVSLPLSGLQLLPNKTTCLELSADVAAWFTAPVKIDLAKTNSCVLPNKDALMIADNYSDMFSVTNIVNP